jgi:WD40 repeat protein
MQTPTAFRRPTPRAAACPIGTFVKLPPELRQHVLGFLDSTSFVRMRRASTYWRAAVSDGVALAQQRRKIDLAWHAAVPADDSAQLASEFMRLARLAHNYAGGLRHTRELAAHTGRTLGVAFAHTGHSLVTTGDDRLAKVWHVGPRLGAAVTLAGHTDVVRYAAFSSSNRFVATASWDGTARVWDRDSQPVASTELRGHAHIVVRADFSPDERFVITVSAGRDAKVWDWRQQVLTGRDLVGQAGAVCDARYAPDGRELATASVDKTIHFWQPNGRPPTHGPATFGPFAGAIESMAYSPDGRLLAVATGQLAVILDRSADPPVCLELNHDRDVLSVEFSPEGRRIVTTARGRLALVWALSPAQPEIISRLRGHTKQVNSAFILPNGIFALTTGSDKTTRLWDVRQRRPKGRILGGHTGLAQPAAVSDDGRYIASAGRHSGVKVWDFDADAPVASSTTVR